MSGSEGVAVVLLNRLVVRPFGGLVGGLYEGFGDFCPGDVMNIPVVMLKGVEKMAA